MPFAPHEIENKKFVMTLRGYQTDEVESFLRAVAADYRAALEAASGETSGSEALVAGVEQVLSSALEQAKREDGRQEWIEELQRIMHAATAELRAAARSEAAEIRAAAQADARQIRASAHAQAKVAELRSAAQAHARDLRERAEADAAEIRAEAERDAAAVRETAVQVAEAAYAEIARQADELRRLESALWSRMHALEHTVVECRQVLSHVSDLNPMPPAAGGGDRSTTTLPSVDELLYRVEAVTTRATETNEEVATADL